ncbi:MAG: hypothetical protein ACYTG0_12835 [Planctomycetota bacterium]
MQRGVFLHFALIAMVAVEPLVWAGGARGDGPWYEGFEGSRATWQPADGDAQFRVLAHERVSSEAFTGEGSEWIAVSCGSGTYVYFSHEVGRPRIIDELLPTVRVKSDRAGVQLLGRVVLPRTRNPRTGKPVSVLVQGTSCVAAGRWQQLRIEQIPLQLSRQVRALRLQLRLEVDPREAYLDRVLLNVFGGPGVTNLWVDDLDVAGYVGLPPGAAEALVGDSASGSLGATSNAAGSQAGVADPATGVPHRRVKLDGSVLLVDDWPQFIRLIQYHGEPLDLIVRLGFNSVWLSEVPSIELLDEASRLGLWVVCPPPVACPLQDDAPATPPLGPASLGPEFEPVLAWNLGQGLTAGDLPRIERWAQRVRAADRRSGRPLIGEPESGLWKYSRPLDVLMLDRSPLGGSLELADYGAWLRQRPLLALPGTPVWTTVQTQQHPSVLEQWRGYAPTAPLPTSVSCEQIRLLAYTAITAGSRGLLFQSHSRLDAPDAATRRRATALELINLELGLIELWLAAGNPAAIVKSQPEVPGVLGVVLRTDRARMLVPIWLAPGAQCVVGQSAANGVAFKVPGVPASHDAYLVIPGAVEDIRHKREAGGMRVVLDELGLTGLVLLAQDPDVVLHVMRQSELIGRRAAQLQRELAVERLEAVRHVQRQLSSRAAARPQSAGWLASARKTIQWADGFLASGDYPSAYRHAQRAMRPLRMLERAHWEAAVGRLTSPVASPMAVSFDTLPWHWRLMEQIGGRRPGPNRLLGGVFEDLATMRQAGWQHVQRRGVKVGAEAELAQVAARSGQYGLRLTARSDQPGDSEFLVETPPAWIQTPPVPVDAGQWVEIQGWVRVSEPIRGSVDGLLIVDSLSGEPLAERIRETAGWQPFTMVRVATRPAMLQVTFILSGLGEAWIDDVTIRPILTPEFSGPTREVARAPRPLRP